MKSSRLIKILQESIIYDEMSGNLTWRFRPEAHFKADRYCRAWNAVWPGNPALNCLNGHGYLHGNFMGKNMPAHVAAWAIYHGAFPEQQIDHINRIRTDNRISNLRDVSHISNCKNTSISRKNTTGIKGVYADKSGFIVRVGKEYIGHYKNLDDAAMARASAAKERGYLNG
ncbi:MAG: HNH endonuclease [Sphingomonadales bacterium]|nr:MAG: HNH endonuclease [Sphingomonadales bacterium]